jgi:SHAQKYF class myb-like DNA-binding protein
MEPDDDYYYDSSPPTNPTEPTQHTQFLDLTNGEGGEGEILQSMYDGDDEFPDHSDFASTKRGTPLSTAQGVNGGLGVASLGLTGQTTDPNTPGRVVDVGSEHTGRWTKAEHEAFLSALQMYGKEWKKVAAKVKTRTVVQTRTHAQKYFQKLAKSMDGSGDEGSPVDMGIASDSGKRTSSAQKKKHRQIPPAQKVQRTASVALAAKVISNLSGYSASAPLAPPLEETSPSSSTMPITSQGFQIGPPSAGSFPIASLGALNPSHEASLLQQPAHGFSSNFSSIAGATTADFKSSLAASLGRIASSAPTGSTQDTASSFLPSGGAPTIGKSSFPSMMKIVAPEPDSAMKRGKFPEPSPAACGKRKLAEIAAARMLAGVLASEPSAPPTDSKPLGATLGRGTLAMDHDIHYPENIEDGTATPPPEEEKNSETGAATRMTETINIPAPQVAASTDDSLPKQMTISEPAAAPRKKTFGLSLQIVNPESLGVSHEQIEKRRKDGQGSPVTPWEGQLQALVR